MHKTRQKALLRQPIASIFIIFAESQVIAGMKHFVHTMNNKNNRFVKGKNEVAGVFFAIGAEDHGAGHN